MRSGARDMVINSVFVHMNKEYLARAHQMRANLLFHLMDGKPMSEFWNDLWNLNEEDLVQLNPDLLKQLCAREGFFYDG